MLDIYPWQQVLWQKLAMRPQHAHAYLLQGPAGIGKRVLADQLAARLLCLHPQALSACGECKSCHLLAAGTHPDLYTLQPEEVGKAIKVDQVRALVDFVVQTAHLGVRKVVVVEPAEAMNPNAANALLKSLEEPAGNTVMLLVSHQPSRLLPTIKSRCVQQSCPLPDEAASLVWMQQKLPQLERQQMLELLVLAGGSPLTALGLFEQDVVGQRGKVVEGVKKLLKHHLSPSQLAESWSAIPLLLLLDWFCDWSQVLLRYQLTGDDTVMGLEDMQAVLQYLAGKSSQTKVLQMQDWLLLQRQKVIGRANLNRSLMLEALLVQWASLPGPR